MILFAASAAASIAIFLIALAFALAFLYFGLKWVSKNEDQTRAALAKVGITTPDPPPMSPDPGIAPPPPVQVDPGPPQPIVLTPPSIQAEPKLIATSGQSFSLSEGSNVVSRESGAIVLAGEATVSRRHAEIIRTGNTAVLRDLGSTNGTFVNGARLTGDQSLRPGDSIQFGAVALRYEA